MMINSEQYLEQLTQLENLTGVKPVFKGNLIMDLYASCLAKGPEYHSKLDRMAQITGIKPDDAFIKQYLLGNKNFSASVSLGIAPPLLDEHFSDPSNRTLDEYQRIYNIFGCYDYFQGVLIKLEQAGRPESRQDEIVLLAVMALRDKNNAPQYMAIKEKLRSLSQPGNPSITQALGKAFGTLINQGDATLLSEFASHLHARSKSRDESFTLQEEIALSTFLQTNHQTSNECLLTLLNVASINLALKTTILKNLCHKGASFFPLHFREWTNALLDEKGVNFPWEDLQYFQETLKIPSADLRRKSLQCLDAVFKIFSEKTLFPTKIHVEQCGDVPNNIFLPLWKLSNGNPELLKKFNALYKTTKTSLEKDALLFGVVNALSIHHHILEKINERLSEIDLALPGSPAQLGVVLKTVCFLDMVSNGEELGPEVLSCLNVPHQTLADLDASLKKIAAAKIREILPRDGITPDLIQTLFEHWGSLEPIFIYAGKMASHHPETLDFLAEMVEHMDPPTYEQWKTWRYNLQNRAVKQQIDHLKPEQLELWKKDYFVEFGTIMVAATQTSKLQQIVRFIAEALREGHLKHAFIQEKLGTVYIAILEHLDAREALLNKEIESLQTDLGKIDALIRFSDLNKLEQVETLVANNVAGKTISNNKKTRAMVDSLKQYLPDESLQKINNALAGEKVDLIPVNELLQKKIATIKQEYQAALDSNVIEQYGLNREQIKNLGPLYQKRKELQVLLDLYRISALDVRKIATNQISDRADKNGETLTTVMKQLLEYFKDTAFAQDIKNIQTLVTQKEDLGGNRHLAMIVTDNPQMLLQVGKYPTGCGSCQNYEGAPERNQSLAGYGGDASTKCCFLIDLNKLPEYIRTEIATKGFDQIKWSIPIQLLLEASLARAIPKLLKNASNEQPILFIEPTYSPFNKEDLSMDKYFNLFLELTLSQPMNIRLMRGEGEETVKVAKSRNPGGQYEDCAAGNAGHAGLGIQERDYTMSARFINKFTPVSEADQKLAERISQGSHA